MSARAPKFKQRDAYRKTRNTTRTVRIRDDGDEHVEIHDDDEERVPDEERGRKVAGEHVAIKVAEHADVVHREQRLADRAEGLTRAERERGSASAREKRRESRNAARREGRTLVGSSSWSESFFLLMSV